MFGSQWQVLYIVVSLLLVLLYLWIPITQAEAFNSPTCSVIGRIPGQITKVTVYFVGVICGIFGVIGNVDDFIGYIYIYIGGICVY